MEFVTAMTFLFRYHVRAISWTQRILWNVCWGYSSHIVSLNSHFYLMPRLRMSFYGVVYKYSCLPFMNWPFALYKHIHVESF